METSGRVRIAMLGCWLTAGAMGSAQAVPSGVQPGEVRKPSAGIPATAPTTLPQGGGAVAPLQAAPMNAATPVAPARQAQVNYSGGLLAVRADNSSLNGILRDVARATGMKITGGVADERVYGSYGPGEPGAVLATLLNGTGSNMVLINDSRQAPQELVLTQRTGGVTPPNPMAAAQAEEVDLPPHLTPRLSNMPTAGGPAAQAQRAQQQHGWVPADPLPAVPAAAPVARPLSPGTATTTEQSPNGVRTPAQIYDELLKLQQQGAKTPQ